MNHKGQLGGVVGAIIAVVVLVIGVMIINQIIYAENVGGAALGTGGTDTVGTVVTNIPVLFAVGGLVLAVSWVLTR